MGAGAGGPRPKHVRLGEVAREPNQGSLQCCPNTGAHTTLCCHLMVGEGTGCPLDNLIITFLELQGSLSYCLIFLVDKKTRAQRKEGNSQSPAAGCRWLSWSPFLSQGVVGKLRHPGRWGKVRVLGPFFCLGEGSVHSLSPPTWSLHILSWDISSK